MSWARTACLWLLIAMLSTPASSQVLGYSVTSGELQLVDLESAPPTPTVVGNVASSGAFGFSGLTMDRNGILWGVSHLNDDLWRIDPTDASATRIGMLDIDVEIEAGLTFDACGRLWLANQSDLYEVDPTDATTSLRASLGEEVSGLTASGESLVGLIQDPPRLARIDPASGLLTAFGAVHSFASESAGLAFDTQGRLWGTFPDFFPIIPFFITEIVSFDPATGGVLSDRSWLGLDLAGNLAITPPAGLCASDIPVDDPLPLALLVFVLASAGVVFLRRI